MDIQNIFKQFKHKNFTYIWTAHAFSHLADNVFRIAFVWQVVELTGSANATAIAFMAFLIPNILMMLFSGAIVDRFSRRSILMISDIGRAVLSLLLVFLILSDSVHFWLLLCIYVFFGIADAFFQPAYTVIITEIMPSDKLVQANSLNGIARQTALILGPTLGAWIISVFGMPYAFSFTSACLIVSFTSIFLLKNYQIRKGDEANEQNEGKEKDIKGKENKTSLLTEIKEGLRYVISVQWLWMTILIAALANAAVSGVVDVGMPFLVKEPMESDARTLGFIFTTVGIGALVGGLIIGHINIKHIKRRGLITYSGIGMMGLCLAVMGLFPIHLIVFISAFLYGLSHQLFGIIWITTLQDQVPTGLLGRVSSVDFVGSYSIMPIGLAVAGVSITSLGSAFTFIIGGLIVLGAAICGFMSRSVRLLGIDHKIEVSVDSNAPQTK